MNTENNKRGIRVGVSKYSPFGVGGIRIYDQAAMMTENTKHLRPFFTVDQKDVKRFARSKNSEEEIVYKVDKNIQGYCIYTSWKPGVERNLNEEICVYVSKNGRDWELAGKPAGQNVVDYKAGIYEVTQENDPQWINIHYHAYYDLGGTYLKVKWNRGNSADSPQIYRVEINYADSPGEGWKNMFIDECHDFSKSFAHSEGLFIDSENPKNHRSVIMYASDDVFEQEIQYALEGGIDFWIFLMGEKNNAHTWSIEQYLSLARCRDIGFCVELHHPTPFRKSGEISDNETWEEYCQRVARYMNEPNYIKVLHGRPLFYTVAYMTPGEVDLLREIVMAAGHENPYIIDAFWGAPRLSSADAISCYNGSNGFDPLTWRYYGEHDKLKVMPNFGIGMNDTCRIPNPPPWGNWGVDKPFLSPHEMRCQLQEAVDFVVDNPESCDAQILTVFDWDSQTEGGWLCPGLNEDGSVERVRLDIFKDVLLSSEPVHYEKQEAIQTSNLVFNPGFEENNIPRPDLVGWKVVLNEGQNPVLVNAFASRREGYKSELCGGFSFQEEYKISIFQNIFNIPHAIYQLSAYVKSSGGQNECSMFIRNHGKPEERINIGKVDEWTKISLKGISISSQSCEVGFYCDSRGSDWVLFDNIELSPHRAETIF
ncbi:MAG: hypothetical protein B6241_12685 [Spirochaetaceae bacterium 4572_59]|nr:MAG: hypothetical protein B6241_12685 [Spirochaetaceae bacterium 4572_59]